ncbi:hypothetical protein [Sphingomonas sp.]|uniref:hypothetical protein n=1 Tax=Sphingomonas sp. TaxID=28214 RepID=UPI000DB6D2B0|nr:hypothetical protein [Sphingomonas sp.]PZU08730.1 MAG: hypothetical protein DI605_12415 [Sphingomonas sp.]
MDESKAGEVGRTGEASDLRALADALKANVRQAEAGAEGKKDRDALLAIVAGLWAAIATSLSATSTINEQKDSVLQGCLGGHYIEFAHRESILYQNWIGAVIGNVIVSLLFAYLLIILCRDLEARYRKFSYLCAAASVIYGVSWMGTGYQDLHQMKDLLSDRPTAERQALSHCGRG